MVSQKIILLQGTHEDFCFRAIQEQMSAHGQDPVSFDDVRNEIFDMVKPKDATKITLKVNQVPSIELCAGALKKSLLFSSLCLR